VSIVALWLKRGFLGESLLSSATAYLGGVAPYHWLDFVANRALYAGADVGNVTQATGYSFTRASQGYYTNSDGTLTLFGHNLCLHSQALDNAAWALTTATRATGISDPDGGSTAITLTATSNNGQILQTVGGSAGTGTNYTVSLYLRRRTGTGDVWIFNPNAGGITTVTLTSSWQRFSVTGLGAAASNSVGVRLATSGDAIDVAFAQLEVGSTATTYLPTTSAAVSALRRGDRGVLIEGSRTNLLLRSQEFDNASWDKVQLGSALVPTVTANQGAAPDGTTTADRVQFSLNGATASGDLSLLRQNNATTGALTHSVWLKSFDGSSSYAMQIIDAAGNPNAITVTGSWQRFIVTATSVGSVGYGVRLRGAQSPTNSNTADVLIWGAQLEASSFASSYVPTTSAAVARSADVLSYTAGVSYPLSLWAEFERAGDTGSNEIVFQVDPGSDTNRAIVYVTNTDTFASFIDNGGVQQAFVTVAGTLALNTAYKGAGRFSTNSVQACRGGTLGTEDTVATMPSSPTVMRLGRDVSGQTIFGLIRRIAVFNSALTDAQLQTVST
jgi:hypothetical protein